MNPTECPDEPWFDPAVADDACDPDPEVTFNDVTVQGNCPGEYVVTRTWTATDACGNTATCSKTISVEDNTPPEITCQPVMNPTECPDEAWFDPAVADDACDPDPVVTFNDVTVQGNCAGEYTVTRTWTATDACGNTATCSKTISVEDNTPPTIHCPNVVSPIDCDDDPWFDPATADDTCDPDVTITFDDVNTPGNCGYSITRTWTATDDCGNTATCSKTIELEDNGPPSIHCPSVMTPVECPGEPWFDPATASDDCTPNPVITHNDVTIQGNCPGEYSVTRTWTATDSCGNTATCSKTISVEDNTPPSIHCPSVMTPVECPGEPWLTRLQPATYVIRR